MFGLTRWSPFEDVLNFQRDVDRVFNQFWSDLPTRTAASSSPSFQVNTTEDGWRIDVPIPGIDPKDVAIDVAGHTLSICAEVHSDDNHNNPTLNSDFYMDDLMIDRNGTTYPILPIP